MKNWLIWKDYDARKDWRQEKTGTSENETVGWYHQLNGHEFEQAPGVGDGQGSQKWCSPWGHKELDTTEWLNWSSKFSKLTLFCSHFPRKGKCSSNVSQQGLIWRDLLKKLIVTEYTRKDYLQLRSFLSSHENHSGQEYWSIQIGLKLSLKWWFLQQMIVKWIICSLAIRLHMENWSHSCKQCKKCT